MAQNHLEIRNKSGSNNSNKFVSVTGLKQNRITFLIRIHRDQKFSVIKNFGHPKFNLFWGW